MRCAGLLLSLSFAFGCGDGEKCDRIQADIDRSAGQRGLNGRAVCSSSDPQVQKDFGSACLALKDCEDHN